MSEPPAPIPQAYECPECGQSVAAPADRKQNVVKCTHCGREFFVGAADSSDETEQPDEAVDSPQPDPQSEFDELRIRQTIVLRRGLYRSRSYAVIASIACAAAAGQCLYLAVQHVRAQGWGYRFIVFMVMMIIAIIGAAMFARHARALHREARQSLLSEPSQAPDFTLLSDGSQRIRQLDEFR